MRNKKYEKGSKKVGSVTRLPGWILELKGKLDSGKGKGVCDEYIKSLNRKLVMMESDEALSAENSLFDARKEAALILTGFPEQKKTLAEMPVKQNGDSAEAIRANRRSAERKGTAKAGMKSALENLTAINEQIINVDTVLEERINKLRSNTREKNHRYMAGIRAGKLKDYEYDLTEVDDSAKEIYQSKHEKSDQKIRDVIYRKMEEDAA